MDENNILQTVRKLLASDQYFDPDILVAINATMATLAQLGVGPNYGITVDADTEWSALTNNPMVINLVKQYLTLKVKLYFDISTASASLVETMKQQCAEFEWRINAAVDKDDTFE